MEYFEQSITGIDGSSARFIGYIPDNSPEMDSARTRPAILIVPGGGYCMTSDREAEPIAFQFLAAGYAVFILRYSCAPSRYPTALLELADCMSEIRAKANTWHVDPARVAVIGFSAGAHLAADFSTACSEQTLREHDHNPLALRPQALLLSYPVITAGPSRHDGSFRALLGDDYGNPEMMDMLSVEQHVDSTTPPVFIWHTMADDCVPVENTLLMIDACHHAQVPVEAHLFPTGCHGLSLATRETAWPDGTGTDEGAAQWLALALDWLSRTFQDR